MDLQDATMGANFQHLAEVEKRILSLLREVTT